MSVSKEASAGAKRWVRKEAYKKKLEELLRTYTNVLVVGVDNVGSLQMQKIRIALRGKGVLIMGKNTLMRMILREQMVANPKLEALLEFVTGNMGLVFTNDDLSKVRSIITEFKVPAGAKSGTFAPSDVFVPAGPTGLDPGQTSFFQALNIATKIVKGTIEIVSQVHLVKKGDKVTSSAVALLSKLDIKPFFYGMLVNHVYEDGSTYPISVLDISKADLLAKFMSGVSRLTAISLAINWPSELTVKHSLGSAFRKLLALSFATDYKFAEAELLAKNAASGAAAAAAAPAAAAAAPAKGADAKGADKGKKAKEVVVEEPEEVGVGGLFD